MSIFSVYSFDLPNNLPPYPAPVPSHKVIVLKTTITRTDLNWYLFKPFIPSRSRRVHVNCFCSLLCVLYSSVCLFWFRTKGLQRPERDQKYIKTKTRGRERKEDEKIEMLMMMSAEMDGIKILTSSFSLRIASAVTLLNCNVFKYLISVQLRWLSRIVFSFVLVCVTFFFQGQTWIFLDAFLTFTFPLLPTCLLVYLLFFCDSFFPETGSLNVVWQQPMIAFFHL